MPPEGQNLFTSLFHRDKKIPVSRTPEEKARLRDELQHARDFSVDLFDKRDILSELLYTKDQKLLARPPLDEIREDATLLSLDRAIPSVMLGAGANILRLVHGGFALKVNDNRPYSRAREKDWHAQFGTDFRRPLQLHLLPVDSHLVPLDEFVPHLYRGSEALSPELGDESRKMQQIGWNESPKHVGKNEVWFQAKWTDVERTLLRVNTNYYNQSGEEVIPRMWKRLPSHRFTQQDGTEVEWVPIGLMPFVAEPVQTTKSAPGSLPGFVPS